MFKKRVFLFLFACNWIFRYLIPILHNMQDSTWSPLNVFVSPNFVRNNLQNIPSPRCKIVDFLEGTLRSALWINERINASILWYMFIYYLPLILYYISIQVTNDDDPRPPPPPCQCWTLTRTWPYRLRLIFSWLVWNGKPIFKRVICNTFSASMPSISCVEYTLFDVVFIF